MTKQYYIDFNSLVVEAENKEEATEIAKKIIEEDKEHLLNDFEVNEE